MYIFLFFFLSLQVFRFFKLDFIIHLYVQTINNGRINVKSDHLSFRVKTLGSKQQTTCSPPNLLTDMLTRRVKAHIHWLTPMITHYQSRNERRNFQADWCWSGSVNQRLLKYICVYERAWAVLTLTVHACVKVQTVAWGVGGAGRPLCQGIAGSGMLFGRCPLWKAARNELPPQANEKRKRECSKGANCFSS